MSARYTNTLLRTLILYISPLLFITFNCDASSNQPTNILVSIKPLHSLISNITGKLNKTELLLSKQQSPHHFQLRPSQKRMINRADILFYSSDNIESFIPALKMTSEKLKFIQLSQIPGIKTLPVRQFNSQHNHSPSHTNDHVDGHIWLSIDNAITISRYVTDVLSKHSPEKAGVYNKNLNRLLLKLKQLKQNNRLLLKGYNTTPYLVYHDAYQYFEVENNLSAAHFITSDPEHSPGIKRVKELRKLISKKHIQCVFYEPPNIPALLKTITEDKTTRLSGLDPVGSQIPAGKEHYFHLLKNTADTVYNCLKSE